MQETHVRSLSLEDPLGEGIATHSSVLAWRIHGQRSLAGYSPLGLKELDMTERKWTWGYKQPIYQQNKKVYP